MKLNKGLFIALTFALLLTALPASAGILPTCATDANAVLQLSCGIQLLLSVSQWILGITGSLALLFFVYGGFLFLTSRGSSTQVEKGKTVLTQAVIGIIIIFGAYIIINFLVANVLKAKFTTEIPKETTPTQTQTQTQVPPAQKSCVCNMSTTKFDSIFYGLEAQREILKDSYLLGICQSALQGAYNQDTNTCKLGAASPFASQCASISLEIYNDVSISCGMK